MHIKTYDIEEILNTKIHPLYISDPMITIKDFLHEIMLNAIESSSYLDELINILFIGFAENKFIDGHIIRDTDGYLRKQEYHYTDVIKLYKFLINYIFSDKTTKMGITRMSDDSNFEIGG